MHNSGMGEGDEMNREENWHIGDERLGGPTTIWCNGGIIASCEVGNVDKDNWQEIRDRNIKRARMMAASKDLLEWAKEAYNEMDQFHSTAYPDCAGGCPTHYIIAGLKSAIQKAEGGNQA